MPVIDKCIVCFKQTPEEVIERHEEDLQEKYGSQSKYVISTIICPECARKHPELVDAGEFFLESGGRPGGRLR